MGHMVGKDLYRKLGRKIDGLVAKAPWNESLYAILKELYTPEEAEVAVRMPYGLASLAQVSRVTGVESDRLRKILDGLCVKGLVMDFWINDKFLYMLSPLVIGIFEFTMMRVGENLNTKEWARLFYSYMGENDVFYRANFGAGKKLSPLRALPYEQAIEDRDHVEILDYEKASSIIEQGNSFAIGLCSCRHEKYHAGHKECSTPLETCTSINASAEYMISHGFAWRASRNEILELVARSKELGLVICADNVKKDVSFLCHCCGCCCNVLLGISRFGYPHSVVTSSFMVGREIDLCTECGDCAEACPVGAMKAVPVGSPVIDELICLGCGVCALKCRTGALKLSRRKQAVLHPEDTFERVILQSLERGNLQNLLFTEPERIGHKFMRGFIGAFLKMPPVKKSLMSETLRSSFLDFMRKSR